jgi:hypothetical protein
MSPEHRNVYFLTNTDLRKNSGQPEQISIGGSAGKHQDGINNGAINVTSCVHLELSANRRSEMRTFIAP